MLDKLARACDNLVMHILLIDNNTELAGSLADFLEEYGYELDFAYSGASGVELVCQNHYDAIILDVSMPGIDGFKTCEIIRNTLHNPVSILFLTARDTLEDKITGYQAGADDYLVKPFAPIELHYRLQALLKRGQRDDIDPQQIGELLIDHYKRIVQRQGQIITLNSTQFNLLKLLARHAPKPVSRAQLERVIWQQNIPDSEALRTHIYRLRQAVDHPFSRPLIETVYGQGYRLVCD